MPSALFINGIFEETLSEILVAQSANSSLICLLQPYSGAKIKLLSDQTPSASEPISLYLSVTTGLAQVSYRASIIGWQDKRFLSADELAILISALRCISPRRKRSTEKYRASHALTSF